LGNNRLPEITLSCNNDSQSCNFQFWAGQKESFFCELKNCDFSSKSSVNQNTSMTICSKAICSCIPGQLLCGESGSIDLTEWFDSIEIKLRFTSIEGPTGPAELSCNSVPSDTNQSLFYRKCSFSEKNMNQLISDVFGDPFISLECEMAGECIHDSQMPGYTPAIPPSFSFTAIAVMFAIAISILISLFVLLSCKESEAAGETEPLLSEADKNENEQQLISQHTPCTLTYYNITYAIEHKRRFKRNLSRVVSSQFFSSTNAEEEIGLDFSVNNNSNLDSNRLTILDGVKGVVKPGEVFVI
jgi:hypothetical protein